MDKKTLIRGLLDAVTDEPKVVKTFQTAKDELKLFEQGKVLCQKIDALEAEKDTNYDLVWSKVRTRLGIHKGDLRFNAKTHEIEQLER